MAMAANLASTSPRLWRRHPCGRGRNLNARVFLQLGTAASGSSILRVPHHIVEYVVHNKLALYDTCRSLNRLSQISERFANARS